MKLVIACDHAGRALKNLVKAHLAEKGLEAVDFGVADEIARADYPVYARKAGLAVASGTFDRGILICGAGTGMAVAACKIKGIRAANCANELMARLARSHNNANVLALGARIVGETLALAIVDAFIETAFEGGRHQDRLDLIEER